MLQLTSCLIALVGAGQLALPPFSAAEDATPAIAPPSAGGGPAAVSGAAPGATRKASKLRNPKGKRSREKEIEGSEARDRFQADTVLKSKYHYNGEPLEVDPD